MPSGSSRKPQHQNLRLRGFKPLALGAQFALAPQGGTTRGTASTPAHAVLEGCQSTRRLGIEWIQLAACDGARLPAGAEIVRLNVGARSPELDGPPLPPSALVAAIGLSIGEPLAQRFEETTDPGRKNPGRIA